jgi:hypothetical protein
MRKTLVFFILIPFFVPAISQIASISDYIVPQAVTHRTLLFKTTDKGISKPLEWGLDMAWLDEANIRRGIAFMGAGNVDIIRSSFTPTDSLVNGDLRPNELIMLNNRINMLSNFGPDTKVVLNCDHPSVHAWYLGNASRWAQLIDVTTRRHQNAGRKVVSVSPFNEPDYGWGQYTGSNGQSDFLKIATELRANPRFDSIRISGGNTLNCDQALGWYNYLKSKINEGNTHQLAGSFNNFANFFTTVRANGHHATADECHNVMEPMVGAEYGLQTAIWWGTAEYARGEFVKASNGTRLAYAEHRPNWTAASVYRSPDGKIQAFGGTSERQAVTTSYRFVSKDKSVYFDGVGPAREYTMTLPGGTGYQNGQTNAERVVNITWGDDIQPEINGRYIIVNRMSLKAIEVVGGSTMNNVALWQKSYKAYTYQQWNIAPVDSRIGGDYSYYSIVSVNSGKYAENPNFSLTSGNTMTQYEETKSGNQHWILEYAGDGWFYIRNRFSAKYMQVASPYVTEGAYIQQADKNGNNNQMWRLIPVGSAIELQAPVAPANLTATNNSVSVLLNWTANTEADLKGYTILRRDSVNGLFNTIARNVTSNSFVDNSVIAGNEYSYAIRATDNSLNQSPLSNVVTVNPITKNVLVARLKLEGNSKDSTVHLNHGVVSGNIAYAAGRIGTAALLNGSNSFIQLPYTCANSKEITISTWVNWYGTTTWQRIFDFGNGENEYMFLTPKSGSGTLRFAIKNNGTEMTLDAPSALASRTWTHIAVTMSISEVRLYVNGALVAQSANINIRPSDFMPVLNYIGRSQFADPLFSGYIDEFSIYNYALSSADILQLAVGNTIDNIASVQSGSDLTVWPVPASKILFVKSNLFQSADATLTIIDLDGKIVFNSTVNTAFETGVDVQWLKPGIYTLKLSTENYSAVKRIIIQH